MPNTKGGKKHKRNKNQQKESKNLRLKEPGQEYAQIIKCKGNCRFDVLCFDGKERMAIMCGTMRNRRFVNQNDIVLVSLRDWQDNVCDIIDNYDENLTRKLKDKGLVPKSIKLDVDNHYSDDDDDNMGFIWSTDMPDSDEEDKDESKSSSDSEESEDEDNGKIDLDDI
uniref:S1-like domain-containing protein n=1 Tax=viral metagenome TaxID=1070528 RepID=A0A6C0C4A4_9ZZZZ